MAGIIQKMGAVLLSALFLFFCSGALAQTDSASSPQADSSAADAQTPSAQDIVNQANNAVNFDQLTAPSVVASISSSGPVGSVATLNAAVDNIDENTALFQWYVDDEAVPSLSGIARTTFSFATTKLLHLVRVAVLVGGQKVTENTVSVQSFNVALVWKTDTFVPPEYGGKALPTAGSRVTVSALPEIRNENPDDLLYSWYLDGESQVRSVGGEQDFTFVVAQTSGSVPVMVDVATPTGSLRIRKAITIPVVKPSVVLQPADAVSVARGAKTTVEALPYYFHIVTLNQLSYDWVFVGSSVRGVPPDPNVLSLIIPENSAAGAEWLSLKTQNLSAPAEQTTANVQINVY